MTDLGLFAVRPDYGDQGVQKNVPLWANYYQMFVKNPDQVLYLYEMTFEAFPPKGPKDSPTPERELTVPEGKKLMQIIRCALVMRRELRPSTTSDPTLPRILGRC